MLYEVITELTKLHEELVTGTAVEARDAFAARDKILGEFSVYVAGKNRSISADD